MKLVYTILVLAAHVYAERRLIEPRLTGARLSPLVQAALVCKVLVYQEWIRIRPCGGGAGALRKSCSRHLLVMVIVVNIWKSWKATMPTGLLASK